MRLSRSALLCLLVTACGPKDGPLDPVVDDGELQTAGHEDAVADGVVVPFPDDFGALNLSDDLAGLDVATRRADGWDVRRTSSRSSASSTASARPHPRPTGRAPTMGKSYDDDELDTLVAGAAPPPPAPAEEREAADLGGTAGLLGSRGSGIGGGGSAEGLGGLGTRGRGSGYGGGPKRKAAAAPVADAVAESADAATARHESVRLASPPAPALKASTTDDNLHYDDYLAYLNDWAGRHNISGWADSLDVTGRRYVQVLDATGRPIPDAKVSVLDPTREAVVWAGKSYGDGRVPLYPNLEVPGRSLPTAGEVPQGGWIVQAEATDGTRRTVRWDGQDAELDITLDTKGVAAGQPVPVDVCFIIDTTGSMGDEIGRIKRTLLSVTDQLRADASQGVDLRYGAVLYRDIGDDYVTKTHAFTDDINGFDRALQGIRAAGGGDGPESLNQGLAVGVAGMEWRDNAARVAFVVADAPPHMDYQQDVTYGRAASAALHRGIRVHMVAASGLDDRGSYAFRQVSQLTRGEFIYIQYGSAAASAADHGVASPGASNNLDDILYQRIRREIDGWGRDGSPAVAAR